jgi:archaeosine synthase beta-subunit
MCNYGHPKRVPADRMLAAVEKAISSLPFSPTTLWVSAYNMFDEREVPETARRSIFKLLAQTSATTVITETHPDSVSEMLVKESVELLGGKELGIEIGIESTNPFVRNWCINKDFNQEQMRDCVRRIHAGGALCYANLLLGAPFLSPSEAVNDAIRSVVDSIAFGVDYCVILPNHIKPHTLVRWLHQRGLYEPPSLWALVEVLQRLEPNLVSRVFTSWVDSEDAPGKSDEEIPPRFEDEDPSEPLSQLKKFNAVQDMEALQRLFEYDSKGRTSWRKAAHDSAQSLIDHVETVFPLIGTELLGTDWWLEFGPGVMRRVRESWDQDSAWLKASLAP